MIYSPGFEAFLSIERRRLLDGIHRAGHGHLEVLAETVLMPHRRDGLQWSAQKAASDRATGSCLMEPTAIDRNPQTAPKAGIHKNMLVL